MRGVANTELTPELAFAIGRAGATVLAHTSDRHKPIIVGRDTRLSGTMLEAAIVAGVTSVGRDVVSIGIVPTPAVATVTVRTGAAAGVMISASHNPIADNGIKFFGPDGFKLSDAIEDEIESLLGSSDLPRPIGTEIGVQSSSAATPAFLDRCWRPRWSPASRRSGGMQSHWESFRPPPSRPLLGRSARLRAP